MLYIWLPRRGLEVSLFENRRRAYTKLHLKPLEDGGDAGFRNKQQVLANSPLPRERLGSYKLPWRV